MAEILSVVEKETEITLKLTQTEYNSLVVCFGINSSEDIERAGRQLEVKVLGDKEQVELYNKLRIHMAN